MIELKLDTSPGLRNKCYYFTEPMKAKLELNPTKTTFTSEHMTFNQAQLVKKAMTDLGIVISDRTY